MKAPTAPLEPAVRLDGHVRAHAFRLARSAVVGICALTIALFVAALPVAFDRYQQPCTSHVVEACGFQLQPAALERLRAAGGSPQRHAAYLLGLQGMTALGHVLVAAFVIGRRPEHPFAWFVASFLVTSGVGSTIGATNELATAQPWTWLPITAVKFLGDAGLVLFWFLFPDGRFVPGWSRWLVPVLLAVMFFNRFTPDDVLASGTWPAPAPVLVFALLFGSGVAAQVIRYRRVSGPEARQQTKWVVFGVAAATVTTIAAVLAAPALLVAGFEPGTPGFYAVDAVWYGAALLIPLSIGVAVSRHRLWDIDPIINRTLVYGALTACVVGGYLATVTLVSAVAHTPGNLGVSVVATALVALLALPLRDRLQRAVDRLMYGRGGEPYAVLAELSRRLDGSIAPEAVLPTLVASVARALELPYAAIALSDGEATRVVASVGEPRGRPTVFPLSHQGAVVGDLLLEPRAVGEGFRPTEEGLLRTIAQQASVAAYAVRQHVDLRRSRERLVVAREEERRRIRRNLHDGLGPSLGSLTLMLDAARNLVRSDPDGAETLLREAKATTQEAIGDIRTLVYDLRPPVLDELGLLAAVRERVARQAVGLGAPLVSVAAPEALPPLPAAVELAAYRIVQEALANAVRHAGARTCRITFTVGDDELRLDVRDDGVGFSGEGGTGVGLRSMRERAEEVGGSFAIETRPGGGTCVRVRLPLDAERTPPPTEGAGP